jgi:acid phosphatase class B
MSQIVSFDFDDTIYLSTGDPHGETVDKMRQYHQEGHRIVIVTVWVAENQPSRITVPQFIAKHALPVEDIHYANHTPKGPILQRIGAIRHYDDEEEQLQSAREYGIEAVLVALPAGIKTWKELASYTEASTQS